MNIILAGMPASGKTTVSKELGKISNRKVIDTDALIVERHGEINKIFEKFGEQYFRDKETEIVKEVSILNNAVISVGGGCLLRQENTESLKSNGKIIYLKATLKTLVDRVQGDTTRPLLKGGAEANLKKLLEAMQKIYEAAADFTVETDNLTPLQIAVKIKEFSEENI